LIKYIFIALIAISPLFSTNILSHKIEKTDKYITIILNFDKSYKQHLKQINIKNLTTITLPEANYKFTPVIINDIKIEMNNKNDNLKIDIWSNSKIKIDTFMNKNRQILKIKINIINANKKEQKNIGVPFQLYLLSFGIIGVILIVFYLIKRKYKYNFLSNNDNEILIISQKHIDIKNKIALIKCNDKEYLVMIGQNSSLLLDKFNDSKTED
jgi:flagellar biogenesis protein FliO